MEVKKAVYSKPETYEKPSVRKLSKDGGIVSGPCSNNAGKGSDCSWK